VELPILTFAAIAARDASGKPHPLSAPQRHLDAAVEWLVRAHDHGQDGGVSYGYSLRGGWRPPYRETTGYIAETFFDLARTTGRAEYRERAIQMCRWLGRVQNPDGSISNPAFDPGRGIVFDTGQVLHGLVRGFEETGDPEILKAAEQAGDWLTTVADGDRRWTRSTHKGIPHVYNTRSAWALLRLHRAKPTADREAVGRANLDWALSQRRGGYYDQNAFDAGMPPFTHTIAYAIRGLLESGLLLGDARYTEAAEASARAVAGQLRGDGFLPGTIDVDGRPRADYCCLTGNCQMAIVWGRLYERGRDELFRRSAVSALRYVMGWQDIATSTAAVRGAIKGSQPVWGAYSRLTFPNWPTKFFVDAMLLAREWLA
jgi:uncharacterized protein YyaL (SSP411 family)